MATSSRRKPAAAVPKTSTGAPRFIELEDWAVHHPDEPYMAPEQKGIMISGVIVASNSRKFKVGQRIITSLISRTQGRTMFTQTGSIYELRGDPTPSYMDWLKGRNMKYDPKRPVILHTGKTQPGRSKPS